jgi:glycosyltransferase involved in cell wall biosynthesis
MIQNPVLTVIMPVYNGGEFLNESLESILNQTFSDFEFLIINDGSTDGSLDVLKQYAEIDSRIKIIDRENKGLVYSLNEGLSLAKGKYIARMDADDLSEMKRFEKQIELMESDNGDICGCHFTIISETNKIVNSFIAPITKEAISCCLLNSVPYAHGAVMFRKSFFDKNRLSYENVKAEDHKLWCDFYENGAIFLTVNDFLFRYRVHKNSISNSKVVTMRKEVNKSGNYLVKQYKECYSRDIDVFSKQELSELEEQLLLLAAFRYSKSKFFRCLKRVNTKNVILSFVKIFSGMLK